LRLQEKFGNGYVVSIDMNAEAGQVQKEGETIIRSLVEATFAGYSVTALKVHAGQLRYQVSILNS